MTTRSSGAGALPLTAQRERYLRLMSSGMSNAQACREVGVHRRTGMRWRHGRTVNTRHGQIHYAPISPPKQARHCPIADFMLTLSEPPP